MTVDAVMSNQVLKPVLAEITRRLRDTFQPSTIYLFGSCAQGEMGPDSDVDIIVVVERSALRFFERGAVALRALRGIAVPIDVQVYTREEFESRSSLPVSLERTVRMQGQVLYAA